MRLLNVLVDNPPPPLLLLLGRVDSPASATPRQGHTFFCRRYCTICCVSKLGASCPSTRPACRASWAAAWRGSVQYWSSNHAIKLAVQRQSVEQEQGRRNGSTGSTGSTALPVSAVIAAQVWWCTIWLSRSQDTESRRSRGLSESSLCRGLWIFNLFLVIFDHASQHISTCL